MVQADQDLAACMSVSPDGRYMLYSQLDENNSSIMLVNNFREWVSPRRALHSTSIQLCTGLSLRLSLFWRFCMAEAFTKTTFREPTSTPGG